MTDATADAPAEEDGAEEKKPSKLPLIIGIVLALLGGGGGFFAVSSGLLPFGGAPPAEADGHGKGAKESGKGEDAAKSGDEGGGYSNDVAFVEMPQVVISMGSTANLHHLRFRASLEVEPEHLTEVETLQPRVVDVLNNYLRALRTEDFEAPGALIRLRSQLLRRIQLVTGEGRVRDLLIMEFVLN